MTPAERVAIREAIAKLEEALAQDETIEHGPPFTIVSVTQYCCRLVPGGTCRKVLYHDGPCECA